jgi:hypothetical protein
MTQPISLDSLPLLFADNAGLEVMEGLSRTVHAARTLDEPIMAPTMPEERVYLYGSVYKNADGSLSMWYQAIVNAQRGTDWVCLAHSRDGVEWTYPKLDALPESPYPNAVHKTHSPSVLWDVLEKNPQRRFKMLGASKEHGKTGYDAAWSADGIHWTAHPKNPILPNTDTVTLSQNPVTGEYLVYHKRNSKVRGADRRTVWLSRSMDFETWSEPQMVFAADEMDDAWSASAADAGPGRTDVYNMSVVPHAAGFLGFPTMFRIIRQRPRPTVAPGQSPADGPIDVHLATSADGVAWQRTWPRINIIPRGKPETFDAGLILGTASTTVDVGDETWLYYTALNTGHGAPMEAKRMTIARAAWRLHGYVSLDADPVGGQIVTKPVTVSSGALHVNADASLGGVRAELQHPDGTLVPGFELERFVELKGDTTRYRAAWAGEAAVPAYPVKVRIVLQGARLFSIYG